MCFLSLLLFHDVLCEGQLDAVRCLLKYEDVQLNVQVISSSSYFACVCAAASLSRRRRPLPASVPSLISSYSYRRSLSLPRCTSTTCVYAYSTYRSSRRRRASPISVAQPLYLIVVLRLLAASFYHIYRSIYLSINRSISLSISLSLCPSVIFLSIEVFTSVCMSVYLSPLSMYPSNSILLCRALTGPRHCMSCPQSACKPLHHNSSIIDHPFTHSFTHSTHTHIHTHTLSLSLSYTDAHTHTHTLSLSLTHPSATWRRGAASRPLCTHFPPLERVRSVLCTHTSTC